MSEALVAAMIQSYKLELRAIRFAGHFGALRKERAEPQQILVDVELEIPVRSLPSKDRRRDVVDYDRVVRLVVDEGTREEFRLLETYAARLVEILLRETPAGRVRIAVYKARAPTCHPVDRAAVELVGTRNTT